GQDSDCNPSSAAGILFTSLGLDRIPEKFTVGLKPETVFSHTSYSFDGLIAVSEKLARDAIVRAGGRVENAGGKEVFVIPVAAPKPFPLEQSWNPGPVADSRYTEAELEEYIRPQELSNGRPNMEEAISVFASGWMI